MDLFINLGIVGIGLIFLGKLALRSNECREQSKNLKILDNIIRYMDSELLAKINLRYGKYII